MIERLGHEIWNKNLDNNGLTWYFKKNDGKVEKLKINIEKLKTKKYILAYMIIEIHSLI